MRRRRRGPGLCTELRSARGMCSGCEQPVTGTNTMPCVPRWRELSRNKSRDEREMWPNRSSHTDTVFPWTDVAEREREREREKRIQTLSIPPVCPSFLSSLLRQSVPRSEFSNNFSKGHLACQRSGSRSSLSQRRTSRPFSLEGDRLFLNHRSNCA